jgi:hypothetical protein
LPPSKGIRATIRNMGMKAICTGTISVLKIKVKTTSWPRKRSRARV